LQPFVKVHNPNKRTSYFLPVLSINCRELDGVELKGIISRFVGDGATGISNCDIDGLAINLRESVGRAIVDVATVSFEVMVADLLVLETAEVVVEDIATR